MLATCPSLWCMASLGIGMDTDNTSPKFQPSLIWHQWRSTVVSTVWIYLGANQKSASLTWKARLRRSQVWSGEARPQRKHKSAREGQWYPWLLESQLLSRLENYSVAPYAGPRLPPSFGPPVMPWIWPILHIQPWFIMSVPCLSITNPHQRAGQRPHSFMFTSSPS